MSISRRGFFRRFLGQPEKATTSARVERYEALETYVRTQLLPYDFYLTPERESELLSQVRTFLQNETDEVLFSTAVKGRLEEVVDAQIEPWRAESYANGRVGRLAEIRRAAPDYVSAFLSDPAYSSTVAQMKATFNIDDMSELETRLKGQIQDWVATANDRLIEQCDVITIRDLVFAQLKSWC